jgi:thiol:disulfide interchange protein DsbD
MRDAEANVNRNCNLVTLWSLAIGALIATTACGNRQPEAVAPAASEVVTSHRAVDVRWEQDWETAFSRARAEGKPVLVNFSAEWCVWCKHLDTITYRDAKVARVLAEQVVPLTVDIDQADRELLSRYRIDAPPTIVLLTGDGRELGRIPGYMPPTGFLKTIESFLGPSVG